MNEKHSHSNKQQDRQACHRFPVRWNERSRGKYEHRGPGSLPATRKGEIYPSSSAFWRKVAVNEHKTHSPAVPTGTYWLIRGLFNAAASTAYSSLTHTASNEYKTFKGLEEMRKDEITAWFTAVLLSRDWLRKRRKKLIQHRRPSVTD